MNHNATSYSQPLPSVSMSLNRSHNSSEVMCFILPVLVSNNRLTSVSTSTRERTKPPENSKSSRSSPQARTGPRFRRTECSLSGFGKKMELMASLVTCCRGLFLGKRHDIHDVLVYEMWHSMRKNDTNLVFNTFQHVPSTPDDRLGSSMPKTR